MPIAITAEQVALQQSIRDWAARAKPLDTVRALEPGSGTGASSREHWNGLASLGLFSIAIPQDAGGAGARITDVAAALEALAGGLVPGPILPTVLTGLVLADCPDSAVAKELLPGIAAGERDCAVALDTAALHAREDPDGGLLLSGVVEPALGAHDASHLLLPATHDGAITWCVLDAAQQGLTARAVDGMDFSAPLTRIELDDVAVPPGRRLAGPVRIDALVATLASAEAVGIAYWCLHTATGYAATREQFGQPIGSFQAIKQLCAGMLCRLEQISALAWDAATAVDTEPAEYPLAAASAAALCLDAAVDNAKDCVQVLGGIGFTWEHDAHLYLRRACALRQLLGGGARWRRRVAELALAGHRRGFGIDLDAEQPEAGACDRAAIRELAREIAALPADERRARLAESGYLVPHWPRPYGLAASAHTQLVIDEELGNAGVTRPDLIIGAWAGPTILRYGTDAQRDRFVPATLRGEITWCQLFSEPGAGSDLASLRTRAERVEGGWLLHGQKVWTSLAHQADWAICLARTDPDVGKHRGITYFLVDMGAAGIDVRPLREITGEERFNEVFLDGVFVPDSCVVGAVGDGWRLARATLANERVAMSAVAGLGESLEHVLALATESGLAGEDIVLDRLGALVAEAHATCLLDLRATLRRLGGQDPGPESSVRKLVGVWHRQAVAEAWLELFGPRAAISGRPASDAAHEFLLTRCLSIAGGTTQILLNVAAERILGLPR
ncbi:MAG: acyl-CoA dehydrogenase [Pseudonocardiaceae bacterium]|nr:acyl-CoA dehydrogenase [Pseudonocardiaceae bacterium]